MQKSTASRLFKVGKQLRIHDSQLRIQISKEKLQRETWRTT